MSNLSSVIIRQANENDSGAIAQAHVASWQKIYRGYIPDDILDNLSVTDREAEWRNLINMNVRLLVAAYENKIIGFASINPSRDNDTNPEICGEISAIYLHPDFWRKGIGTLLINQAIFELKMAGFREVILWVVSENLSARDFYEKNGFIKSKYTKLDEFINGIYLSEIRYYKKL